MLEFAKKPEMAYEEWTSRQEKFQSFFGPGVKASLEETAQVGTTQMQRLLLAVSRQYSCPSLLARIKLSCK